ncbi:MAG: tetratricopeptide repeat protein [Polyangia bacterium]
MIKSTAGQDRQSGEPPPAAPPAASGGPRAGRGRRSGGFAGGFGRGFGRGFGQPGALGSLLWALVLVGTAVALCGVPLFNLLGYESSLVLAVLASLFAVRQGVHVVHKRRERVVHGRASSHGPAPDEAPLGTVLGLWLRALLSVEAVLLLPLLVLLGNGLRVRNCSYASGLHFYAMLPAASGAIGAAVGVAAALWTARRRRGLVLGCALVVGSVLWSVWRFAATPAIYAYDPFFGYYPGALYDEAVAVGRPLYWARLLHALVAMALLVAAAQGLDGYSLQARLRAGSRELAARRRGVRALLAGVGLAAALLYLQGGALGLYTDEATLRAELRGELLTPHFVLRYRPGGPIDKDLALYAREHELRYRQLHALLGVEPTWRPGLLSRLVGIAPPPPASGQPVRVTSYLFDSAEQKRRLIGAANTYIAKPWRRAVYLQHEAWPHPILRHELAHVFAGAAGDRLLRLSLRGILPQPGLIEGLAVAADWRGGGLTPHQAVKAMREDRIEPRLTQVLGLSFWGQPSSRAYTLVGSFCRFLLDKHGPAPLLRVYHDGGRPEDFARAYGVPFATLQAEWSALIDSQPLDRRERELERERLRRPAVFHKVCAHELAVRKQKALSLYAQGDAARATALLRAVCADDPQEPQHLAELMEFLWSAGRYDESRATATALLAHPTQSVVLRGRALSRLGDIAVVKGELAEAAERFRQAEALPLDTNSARQLTARRLALADAAAGPLLLSVLVGVPLGEGAGLPHPSGRPSERSDAVTAYTLAQAVQKAPELGLARYVLGRFLQQRGGPAEASRELGAALALGLPDERFVVQARLLLGQAQLLAGQPAAAEATFQEQLRALPPHDLGQAAELADWIDRARAWPSLPGG